MFGTGTGLDTSRLLSALARQTGVDHKSITCYMLGEHGNQQFAPWSCVSFNGMPLDKWAETDERFRFDREALKKESIGGGWVTFSGKYCTEYGISTTAARMVHIVLHDEKAIMPASMELCGEYGEHDVVAGVPCVIGANGVEEVVELPLTAEEKQTFHACCDAIRVNMEHLSRTLIKIADVFLTINAVLPRMEIKSPRRIRTTARFPRPTSWASATTSPTTCSLWTTRTPRAGMMPASSPTARSPCPRSKRSPLRHRGL